METPASLLPDCKTFQTTYVDPILQPPGSLLACRKTLKPRLRTARHTYVLGVASSEVGPTWASVLRHKKRKQLKCSKGAEYGWSIIHQDAVPRPGCGRTASQL